MLLRLEFRILLFLLVSSCTESVAPYRIQVVFPDEQSREAIDTFVLWAFEGQDDQACSSLLGGRLNPSDLSAVNMLSTDLNQQEGLPQFLDIPQSELVFYAQGLQQDVLLLHSCQKMTIRKNDNLLIRIEFHYLCSEQGLELACNGIDDDCDGLTDECVTDQDCQHGSQCISTVCSNGTCECEYFDGRDCDDGQYCTVGETCLAGQCSNGAPRDCSEHEGGCVEGTCDEDADRCIGVVKPEGTACDDQNYCTVADRCDNLGICVGETRTCEHLNGDCTQGRCDEKTQDCIAEPVNEGASCDDGIFCSDPDTCQNGVCTGPARNCDAVVADDCHQAICNEGLLVCQSEVKDDGSKCDDGLFCTVGETCQAGQCTNASERDCTANGGGCVDGICDEDLDRCVGTWLPSGTPCNDELYCTIEDECDNEGNCFGSARVCDHLSDDCSQGRCSEELESCVADPLNEGEACDDGIVCSQPDTCQQGVCTGPNLDSDSDGVCDVLDQCEGENISGDLDNDGICNDMDFDDDGDNWSDADEVACGTEPTLSSSVPSDSDNDNVCDPLDQCNGDDATGDADADGDCNDIDSDDDQDGWLDSLEIACGSDPQLADSVPNDSDSDGVCDPLDLCAGNDMSGDFDTDGICNDDDTDDDGDFWSDAMEYACGTDPWQQASTPNDEDNDGVCDSLDQCVGDDSTGDTDRDGECNDIDSDDDADNWSDGDENACGSDPLSSDSVPDDNDLDGFCDPLDLCLGNNASGDTDADGSCNDIDTDDDGDGWSDTDELNCGTDPVSAASVPADGDADGVCDPFEICIGDNATGDTDNDGTCNDLDEDDDGDTWSDTEEIDCGTDPLVSTSVPIDSNGDGTCELVPTIPYLGTKQNIPGIVEIENYDEGGLGIAYYDTSTTQPNSVYRTDYVDISTLSNGYVVGSIERGEWLKYTVDIEEGYYDIEVRMTSSWNRTRVLHFHIDDVLLISKGLPDTGGWDAWTTITIPDVYIPGGNNKVLRLYFDCVRMSINWINFKKL